MSRKRNPGLLSIFGGLSSLALSFAFYRSGWGVPGTSAYRTYETLNRLTGYALLMMSAGWFGLTRSMPKGYGRVAAGIAFVASVVMVIGNAAEFWLFTAQPYSELNARNWSWIAYLLGSLVQIISATIIGIYVRQNQLWPRSLTLIPILALPLALLGPRVSAFLGPAILALVIGGMLLAPARGNRAVAERVSP